MIFTFSKNLMVCLTNKRKFQPFLHDFLKWNFQKCEVVTTEPHDHDFLWSCAFLVLLRVAKLCSDTKNLKYILINFWGGGAKSPRNVFSHFTKKQDLCSKIGLLLINNYSNMLRSSLSGSSVYLILPKKKQNSYRANHTSWNSI